VCVFDLPPNKFEPNDDLTEHHAKKAYRGSRGRDPPILDLRTRRRWVVSYTLRPQWIF